MLILIVGLSNAFRMSPNQNKIPITIFRSTFESAADGETLDKPALPNLDQRRPLKTAVLAMAAKSSRGEIGTESDKLKMINLIEKLESFNPIPSPASSELSIGSWELVYSSTYLFRSSPLFMAARAVCNDGEEAERFNLFCRLHREALAWTTIGKVLQIVTESKLISKFETSGSPFIGLPGPFIKGCIVSESDIESKDDSTWVLFMDTIRIQDSNVPGLSQLLDGFAGIPTRTLSSILESAISLKAPKPKFYTTYVDTHMRISRDQDDNVFVYNRA